jgi:hypothetical protein
MATRPLDGETMRT